MRLSVENGLLDILGPDAAHGINADGTWPSAVFVSAAILKRVASHLPTGDPTALRAEDSRLYIGTFSVEARLVDIAPAAIQLPIDATDVDILIAMERLGEARVAGSIRTRPIEDANEKLLERVKRALQQLELYGVTYGDVISLVRRALRERATQK